LLGLTWGAEEKDNRGGEEGNRELREEMILLFLACPLRNPASNPNMHYTIYSIVN
jgi:hypothetical protein